MLPLPNLSELLEYSQTLKKLKKQGSESSLAWQALHAAAIRVALTFVGSNDQAEKLLTELMVLY
jgi:hypothetical protein